MLDFCCFKCKTYFNIKLFICTIIARLGKNDTHRKPLLNLREDDVIGWHILLFDVSKSFVPELNYKVINFM